MLANRLALPFLFIPALLLPVQAEPLRERMLRSYAIDAGLVPPEQTWVPQEPAKVAVGQKFFESTLLSSERDTACASCHLDRFGSADGLPIAIGVEGQSFGATRVRLDGDKLPRNVLPFWGRGGKGFETMFWDGRVAATPEGIVSQFGANPPSADPLVVAAHLPPLELGEMVMDRNGSHDRYQAEDVSTAMSFADTIVDRLRLESSLVDQLALAINVPAQDITFTHVMASVASFITFNFRLQKTRFHAFVFDSASLTEQELRGGLVFYGKGQCISCHRGAYFTDFEFHAIAFPQFGHGFNGFGTDYGRYNVTQDPDDLFRFRTPPLYNVTKTAPYSHSGSVATLEEAIRYHVDPLAFSPPTPFTPEDRQLYARRLGAWAQDFPITVSLSNTDIEDLKSFLATLEYESVQPVAEIPINPSTKR